jgi:hypothetical protein
VATIKGWKIDIKLNIGTARGWVQRLVRSVAIHLISISCIIPTSSCASLLLAIGISQCST